MMLIIAAALIIRFRLRHFAYFRRHAISYADMLRLAATP